METPNKDEIQDEKLREALINHDNDIIGNYLETIRHAAELIANKQDLDDPENIASEAILTTIQKIPRVQWKTVKSPKDYLFRMVRNFIISKSRQKRLRPSNLTLSELANLGGNYADDEAEAQINTPGWHGLWDKDYLKKSAGNQIKHAFTQSLSHYFQTDIYGFLSEDSLQEEHLKVVAKQYNKSRNQLATISKSGERERMEKYLRGFTCEAIGNEEGVTRQAAWKTINHYCTQWGWDGDKVKKLRIIWLLFALLDVKKQLVRRDSPLRDDEFYDIYDDYDSYDDYLDNLYKLLLTDVNTKAYFYNLPKDEVHYIAEMMDGLYFS